MDKDIRLQAREKHPQGENPENSSSYRIHFKWDDQNLNPRPSPPPSTMSTL